MKDECKCKNLEKIAETSIWNDPEGTRQTRFYECSKCKKLYEELDAQQGRYRLVETKPYEGHLTKEEIIDQAGQHCGEITTQCEIEIMLRRK